MVALAFKPETVSKVCSACEERKLKYEFTNRGGKHKHLLRSQCKTCTNDKTRGYQREYWHRARKDKPGVLDGRAEYSRWYKRLVKYGITKEEFVAMVERQEGKCAICGGKQGMELRVDHDHSSGEVRELLCAECNSGIGLFKEDVDIMRKAIKYVQKHGETS